MSYDRYDSDDYYEMTNEYNGLSLNEQFDLLQEQYNYDNDYIDTNELEIIEYLNMTDNLEYENAEIIKEIDENKNNNNNKNYIGICITTNNLINKNILLGMFISNKSFFKYKIENIKNYLIAVFLQSFYSWEIIDNYEIQIMKLDKINNKNVTIVKTYWIKLIQRHWKKIMKKRKDLFEKRNSFKNRLKREIQISYYPLELQWIPTLRSMLNVYKLSK